VVFIEELQRDSGVRQLGVPRNHVLKTVLADQGGCPKVVDQVSVKTTKTSQTAVNMMHWRNINIIFYGRKLYLGNLWEPLEAPSDRTLLWQTGLMNLDFQKAFGQELSSKVLRRFSGREVKVTAFKWMDAQ